MHATGITRLMQLAGPTTGSEKPAGCVPGITHNGIAGYTVPKDTREAGNFVADLVLEARVGSQEWVLIAS